jgi:hypothetical protein
MKILDGILVVDLSRVLAGPAPTLPKLHVPVLSDIPVLGPVVFGLPKG